MIRSEWPRDPHTRRFLPHTGYPKGLDAWLRSNERRVREHTRQRLAVLERQLAFYAYALSPVQVMQYRVIWRRQSIPA